jgi:protein-arginine kinase activator protein McsA
VALEKAIAREDFEAAAALRDRIRDLENRGPEQS